MVNYTDYTTPDKCRLKELLDKPRLAGIYSLLMERREAYCQLVPLHTKRTFEQKLSSSRGNIVFTGMVSIEYNEDRRYSELSLAHEFMHYLLVLEGAKLPAPHPPDHLQFLHRCLMNAPHHTVLLHRLRQQAYSNDIDQDSFSVSELTKRPPDDLFYQPNSCREWLLSRMNIRLFVTDQTADATLRPYAEKQGIADLYDMICAPPPSTNQIEHINSLSEAVIETYQLHDHIALVDVEEYMQRYEQRH